MCVCVCVYIYIYIYIWTVSLWCTPKLTQWWWVDTGGGTLQKQETNWKLSEERRSWSELESWKGERERFFNGGFDRTLRSVLYRSLRTENSRESDSQCAFLDGGIIPELPREGGVKEWVQVHRLFIQMCAHVPTHPLPSNNYWLIQETQNPTDRRGCMGDWNEHRRKMHLP